MILDVDGVPLRREIGYLLRYRRDVPLKKKPELVSAIGFATVQVEDDDEEEE